MYIVVNKNIPNYDEMIAKLTIVHANNADGAKLSVAELKNTLVLIKVNGFVEENKYQKVSEFKSAENNARRAFFKLNRAVT